MTATTPQPMEGTEAPNQIEYLYERYRHLLKWVLVVIIAFFGINYLIRWQAQNAIDQKWSQFAVTVGLDGGYTDKERAADALTDLVSDKDLAELEQGLTQVDAVQKPYLLLAIARRAMLDSNWERAETALSELESSYPTHTLVAETPYPIQVRPVVKQDEEPETTPNPRKKPEFEPAEAGSIVGMMRKQIQSARGYERPKQLEKLEPPADAPKVKFELSEGYGSFTIALMPEQAPHHVAKFLELARAGFWKDLNVDEVQRPGTGWFKSPMQFHLGFATAKGDDRSKWSKTEPSENLVDYEDTGLSHFEGAVAARPEADGKSCADRFYVCGEDSAMEDGARVVFGYVVEGLENVKTICEATLMTTQEDEAGRGTPSDFITVVSVTVIE